MCPHVVLGIPTHADREAASIAFARAARRVRNNASSPFSISDLTGALAQIEANSGDQPYRLQYALPADPRVYRPGHRLVLTDGPHDETSDLDPLFDFDVSDQQRPALGFLFLNAAIFRLFQWEWTRAEAYAKQCLKLSTQEEVRDEALNVIALSLAIRGQFAPAIDALRKATEGQWTLGLQVNLSILNYETDPRAAIRQMAFLISGERDSQRRLKACRLAIELWRRNEQALSQSGHDQPPYEVLHASRLLLADAEISEEDFYQLGNFLAQTDPDALKHSRCVEVSPHRRTPSGALILARMDGFDEFLKRLVSATPSEETLRPWIRQDLDNMIHAAVGLFAEDPKSGVATSVSLCLVTSGLDNTSLDRVLLKGLLVQALVSLCESPDECPKEDTINWLSEAKMGLRNLQLVDEQQELAVNVLQVSSSQLGIAFLRSNIELGQQAEGMVNRVSEVIGSARHSSMINRGAVRDALSGVFEWMRSVETLFPRLIALADDTQVKNHLQDFLQSTQALRQYAETFTR